MKWAVVATATRRFLILEVTPVVSKKPIIENLYIIDKRSGDIVKAIDTMDIRREIIVAPVVATPERALVSTILWGEEKGKVRTLIELDGNEVREVNREIEIDYDAVIEQIGRKLWRDLGSRALPQLEFSLSVTHTLVLPMTSGEWVFVTLDDFVDTNGFPLWFWFGDNVPDDIREYVLRSYGWYGALLVRPEDPEDVLFLRYDGKAVSVTDKRVRELGEALLSADYLVANPLKMGMPGGIRNLAGKWEVLIAFPDGSIAVQELEKLPVFVGFPIVTLEKGGLGMAVKMVAGTVSDGVFV